MPRIHYPAIAGAALLNGLALAGLVTLAQPLPHEPVKALEVALITAPEPAPMATEPAPEPVRPPEPLPVSNKPPPPPPKPKKPKLEPQPKKVVEPAPTPEPTPVAIAPAATESSTNTISAEAAEPSTPVATTVAAAPAAVAAAPAPAREPPRADASWSGNAPPPYPMLARRLGEQGEVRLDIQISPEGTVTEIKLKRSSGSSLLDQTAMDTVRKWRFKPATVDGKAVTEWYYNWRWVFKLEG